MFAVGVLVVKKSYVDGFRTGPSMCHLCRSNCCCYVDSLVQGSCTLNVNSSRLQFNQVSRSSGFLVDFLLVVGSEFGGAVW